MNAERVLSVLDENRDELRRLGVRRLGLFGSTARNKTPEEFSGLLSWHPLPLGLSALFLAAGAVIQLLARNVPDRL